MFDVCVVADPGQTWEMQWSYVLSHFKPRNLYSIGEMDPRVRTFQGVQIIGTAEELPDLTLVMMNPENGFYFPGDTPIDAFDHPEECIYLFGSDHNHLSTDHLGERVPDHKVYIPTDTPDTMFSFMAAAVTLYDRKMKNG